MTIREVADIWLEEARTGLIRNRSGRRYKPSTLRGYERSLRLRVLPKLGSRRLSELRRADVQRFCDRLLADGHDPATITNTLNPLQAIYRRALARDVVSINRTVGIELAAVEGRRDRIADPAEAAALIAALPHRDQALWATALYAGLRRGELRGLRWSDVDFDAGLIRVRRSWDDEEGQIEVKTRAGERAVPILGVLRQSLLEQKLASPDSASEGFVFGVSAASPFVPSNVRRRALTAWKAAELNPISLHEARHTFASLLIAAGVNAKAISTYMGHTNIAITFDRYGHLMPGNESESAILVDRYLATADEAD